MKSASRLRLVLAITALMLPAWSSAMPSIARLYKQEYGYMPSCNACHSDGGGSTLNSYGKAYKAAGKNVAAFADYDTRFFCVNHHHGARGIKNNFINAGFFRDNFPNGFFRFFSRHT